MIVGLVIGSESLDYTKTPLKTENFKKMVWGAVFRHFCSQYHIVSSKDTFLFPLRNWLSFHRRHISFQPILTVGSIRGSKSLTYTKIPLKSENLFQNGLGCTFWNILQPIPDSFKERNFSLRNWLPFKRRYSSFEKICTILKFL